MSDKLDAFGWLADRTGCGTIRMMQPLTALRELGYNTDFNEKMVAGNEYLPKTLIGQRVCKDGPSDLWFQIGVMRERPRTVYELDDDLWNVDPSNAKAFKWFINGIDDGGGQHNVQGNIARNAALADVVTCTTEPLAELLGLLNPNVKIIPNYLPRWVFDWERPRRDTFTVGWGGSSSHDMDWRHNGPQIKRWLDRNPKVDFRLIGGRRGDLIGLPNNRVKATGWIGTVEDYWKTVDYDIGVIPLRPHVFNQSKSHLKFLENSALGIPTVAADAGPYSRTIEHGKTGFLVKRDHEWAKYLNLLTNDEAAREEIGANAKAWARTQILEDHIGEWEDVLFN